MDSAPLKYLFTATFEDGSVIQQTPEDTATADPLKSAFYDVLEHEKVSPLVRFELKGSSAWVGLGTYAICFPDAHFEVNDASFYLHQGTLSDARVIFWRQNTRTYRADGSEASHKIVYELGFEALSTDGLSVTRSITF